MDTRKAYDEWSAQYDQQENKTRDLEAVALRKTLASINFNSCLEIGCGTGKNTEWLVTKAQQVLAVDFSDKMLEKAKAKIASDKVEFHQADITKEWTFVDQPFELVSFSLILEHVENLEFVFEKVLKALAPEGYVYIRELHPYKQYTGSKARFDTSDGQQILTCFTHHLSDFIQAAKKHYLRLIDMNEYFDDNDPSSIPRVITLLFKK